MKYQMLLKFSHACMVPLMLAMLAMLALLALNFAPANAQGVIAKNRVNAVAELEKLASVAQGGVRSGSCLRPIGDVGTEEFTVYLLLPVSRIEGFVVEFSGDDGAPGEVVANAGIASFTENGDTVIRGNLGMEWVADAYRVAANFIRTKEMYLDDSYGAAFARLPTERCPIPYSQRESNLSR
nr:MAG: hypothetical protein E4H34_06510 [Hyphomicrobiales bacterium]